MNADPAPPVPQPPAGGSTQPPVPKRRRWLLIGCGGLLALMLIIVATVAITIWWIQRPIKPVVLSAAEKKVVEEKIDQLSGTTTNSSATTSRSELAQKAEPTNRYTAGSRELRLTERELNGLLNENTELGQTVRLELDKDAVNAYLAVPIPKDFPIGGGKMFRARGRFRVSLGQDEKPFAVLEDVTVFGLSLPKDWLGGIKGENLLADAVGEHNGKPILRGVKSFHVVPGALVLEVQE
jgi:hypothetical protein